MLTPWQWLAIAILFDQLPHWRVITRHGWRVT